MKFTSVTALLVLSLSGCFNPVQSVSNYKTSCTVDGDCSPVFAGNVCTEICYCPNAAIASSDAARYAKDKDTILSGCGARPAIACAADCAKPSIHCASGTCALP